MQEQDHQNINRKLRIASRGSKLALWQADYVKSLLAKQGIDSEVLVIKTTGDRVQDRFLHEIGGKGVFVKEIEQALLDGKADIAVHSLKDLPAQLPDPFAFAAVLPRHKSGDTMVLHPRAASRVQDEDILTAELFAALGSISVGTGSLRRSCFLKAVNQDAKVVPIRGNVDTRLSKLRNGDWDSLILAGASFERLGLAPELKQLQLDPHWFIPSPSQGALVVESLSNFEFIQDLQFLDCLQTRTRVSIERQVLLGLGGDCTLPIGVHSYYEGGELKLAASVLNHSGQEARVSLSWAAEGDMLAKSNELAGEVVQSLVGAGVNPILKSLKLPEVGS
ncbi:MAG: hydroxymethylbilane synthase [Oligoflexales bacterium]|nr:hydroxymethylbilane synthase [Oligoflexales bacterium]